MIAPVLFIPIYYYSNSRPTFGFQGGMRDQRIAWRYIAMNDNEAKQLYQEKTDQIAAIRNRRTLYAAFLGLFYNLAYPGV